MTHPWKWAVVVALGLAACERSNVTRTEIDATALRSAAPHAGAADGVGIGAVHVNIRGAGFDAIDVLLDPNTLQASVDVPSGPDRTFDVTALSGDDASLVTYFGRVRRDMPSAATVTVVVPAFPAGVVRATAATLDGTPLPNGAALRLQAVAPRADAPAAVDVQVQDGGFSQPLPTGAYQVTGSVKLKGLTYVSQQDFLVRAGEVTDLRVVLRNIGTPHLAFSAQPAGSVAAGAPLSAEVSLLDRSGALVTSTSPTVTLTAIDLATGAAVPVAGAAQGALSAGKFATSTLGVSLAGGPYALEANAPGLATARSSAFSVVPGGLQATGVVVPAQVVAGVPFAARVGGVDAFNNIVPSFVGTVQLSTSDTAATVPASVEVTAADAGGHAVTLTLVTGGPQTLQTSAQTLSGRTPITVVANTPASLAFVALADPNVQACLPPSAPVQVRLFDRFGNFASNGAADVTLGLLSNPGRAPLRGTLTVAAVGGVASFGDVTLSAPGLGYVLRASAAGLAGASSGPLNARAPTPTLRLLGSASVVASGPVAVAYVAQQACGEATDVALSYDTANGEVPASPLGNGTAGVLEQAAAPRTLAWDMPRDLGANANTATVLHLRPRSQGVVGAPVNVQVMAQSAVNPQSLGAASGATTNVGGSALVAIAVGDLDGDGRPDLVGVSGTGSSVAVFLQKAAGVYTALPSIALSGPATRIQLGDLDRDGDLDAVVAMPQAGNAQILINDGSGALQPGTAAGFSRGVYDLALADLNRDGRLDIAVTSDSNGFSYSNNTNFTTPLGLSTAAVCTRGLAAADMNRDGAIDLVVADCNRRVFVANNTGTSFSFVPYATDANVDAVAVGDLNRDGLIDVVAVHGSDAHLTVFKNMATPPAFFSGGYLNLGTTFPLPSPARDVAVADLNGDGLPDLLALLDDGTLAALPGDGSGAFGAAVPLAPRGVGAIAVADLNRDSTPDVALATANGVAAALNQSTLPRRIPAHAARGLLLAEAPLDVAVGNLDADGNPDLLVAMGTEVQAFLGRGDGLFTPGPTLLDMAQSVALADLNHDHLADAVLAEAGASTVSTALSTGGGSFATPLPSAPLGSPAQQVLVGDLDEDGNVDVAALTSGNPGSAAVLFGDGTGALSAPSPVDMGSVPLGEGRLADVTGDGHLDLLAINAADGNVLIAAGNGDGSFAAPVEWPASVGSRGLRVADLDHDGIPDLVVLGGAATYAVLHGLGGGSFALPVSTPVGAQQTAYSLAVGDYNADGRPDAFLGATSGALAVHDGDGAGGFSSLSLYTSLAAPQGLLSADLDGDGTDDVVAYSRDANALVAHMSSRSGFFAAPNVVLTGNQPHHPQLLDANRDGRLDVLVPCVGGTLLTVALGTGGGGFGSPTSVNVNGAGLIATADFNHDGVVDVVTTALNGNTLLFSPGNGSGGFPAGNNSLSNRGLNALTVVDFNRDSVPDLLATARGTPSLVLFTNAGNGSFTPTYTLLTTAPREAATGDFNRDGKPDVVVTQDTNALWVGTGDGSVGITPGLPVALPAPAQSVAVADLDGDGLDDIVVTLPASSAVAFLRNLGGGLFAQTALRPVSPTPTQLSVGDVDGDGALDGVVSTDGGMVHVLLGDRAGGVKDDWTLVTHGDATGVALGDVNGDGRLDIVATSNSGDVVELILSGYP